MKSLIYLFNFVVLIFITSSIDLDSIENRILIQPKKFSKGNNKIEINDCDVQFINRNFKKDCVFDKIIENFNLDYNKINRSSNSTNSNNSCIITIETAVLNCQIVKFNPSSRDWSNYEYFKLEIKENYNVIINANYLNGLIYGLETFLQAIVFPNTYEHNLPNENIYLQELPILIEDYPDYYYRGFMLDVSRHFFSIKCLMQIIDGLVASKINVFHLHLTDDDSFPY